MQSFLLDTCAALWIVADGISKAASDQLLECYRAGVPTYVSPITALEVGTLARKGRFKSPYSPQRWFQRLVTLPNVALADMPPELLLESCFLPGIPPNDPADRILAATARECDFVLMTRDRALLDYAREGHIRAAEC